MANAGDRTTPERPAFVVDARDRRIAKRPVVVERGADEGSRRGAADVREWPTPEGARWWQLSTDDLLVKVFILTVGVLYTGLGGLCVWLLFAPRSHGHSVSDDIAVSIWASALLILGALQLVRCFISTRSFLGRAAEMLGPRSHPFEGHRLYWIPLGPAVLITLLLRLLGLRGGSLRETQLLPRPERDPQAQRPDRPVIWNDLPIRVYCFLLGMFFGGGGIFMACASVLERDAMNSLVAALLAVIFLPYGSLQLSRCVVSAGTPIARWAETWGPERLDQGSGVNIVFCVLTLVIVCCLRAFGIDGQDVIEIDPSDSAAG